ncbi:HigA family addiction module antitoxin [Prochlorothrix hollandica]|uniref:HigA family addiction module antitoxin n=1 Tax=Prochlorothrix hollandica TaxID=1223 RepID=UPI00333F21BD
MELLKNPHVGEILKLEFLEEINLSTQDLANRINIPSAQIDNLIQGRIVITAAIDLRLCRYFSLSDGYFLRLQNAHDLMEAKRSLTEELNQIVPYQNAIA